MNKLVLRGIAAELETIRDQGMLLLDETTELKRKMADLELQNAMLLELVRTLVNRPSQQIVFPTVPQSPPMKLPGILTPDWVPTPEIWSGADGIKVT